MKLAFEIVVALVILGEFTTLAGAALAALRKDHHDPRTCWTCHVQAEKRREDERWSA